LSIGLPHLVAEELAPQLTPKSFEFALALWLEDEPAIDIVPVALLLDLLKQTRKEPFGSSPEFWAYYLLSGERGHGGWRV